MWPIWARSFVRNFHLGDGVNRVDRSSRFRLRLFFFLNGMEPRLQRDLFGREAAEIGLRRGTMSYEDHDALLAEARDFHDRSVQGHFNRMTTHWMLSGQSTRRSSHREVASGSRHGSSGPPALTRSSRGDLDLHVDVRSHSAAAGEMSLQEQRARDVAERARQLEEEERRREIGEEIDGWRRAIVREQLARIARRGR